MGDWPTLQIRAAVRPGDPVASIYQDSAGTPLGSLHRGQSPVADACPVTVVSGAGWLGWAWGAGCPEERKLEEIKITKTKLKSTQSS